jgi:hypothetical protein
MAAVTTPTAGCWRILLKKNCDSRKHHPLLHGVICREADPQRPPTASLLAHISFTPTCCFATTTLLPTPLHGSTRRRGKFTLSASTNDDYETTQAELDNYANQMNPNNDAYWSSMDDDVSEDDANYDNDEYEHTQAELDNHANQMNPNNDAYWSSRGDR